MRLKPLAALSAVPVQRVLDDRIRRLRRRDRVHLHDLPFKLFVILEESPQHRQPMRRHLAGLAIHIKLRIVRRHRDDLVILLAPSSIVISPIVRTRGIRHSGTTVS